MSRYDGLIIPRSYSEYINKTEAATLSQALQLSGVMDNAPTAGSSKAARSSGIKSALVDIECQIANIPRITPKDITSYVTDGTLWKRLNGTNGFKLFEDLRVGDYIKMSRPISAYERSGQYQLTGSQFVTIAGIDTLMYKGDQGSGNNGFSFEQSLLDKYERTCSWMISAPGSGMEVDTSKDWDILGKVLKTMAE